jgi:hypothetical protein
LSFIDEKQGQSSARGKGVRLYMSRIAQQKKSSFSEFEGRIYNSNNLNELMDFPVVTPLK